MAHLPVAIPLEVQVDHPADNPQSPLLSPQTPTPQVPSLPQGSPVWDATSFTGFYTLDDVVDIKQRTVDARAATTNPGTRIEEPDVSFNLKTFLRFTPGPSGR